MAASEMKLMGVSPKGIDAEVFLCVTDARQAEEIILLRSRCAVLMPDVEKILQHDLDDVHQREIESVSVWDVPEFSHVDGWGSDWLAASGLDEAAYQIRHLLYAEHCTNGRVEVSDLSDQYWIARTLVQLVAQHVPAAITVEQALPLIHDAFSVYKPAWGHEHDEEELGYHAGRLYCRLTQRELADLVLAAVPDAPKPFPRPLYGCPM